MDWELRQWPIQGPAAGGVPDLTIDTAWRDAGANVTLVISSGLHGVEGPFGAAVLQRFFEAWMSSTAPPPANVLAIHALNPYGYACGRRADGLNRDLNRNFLLTGQPYSGAPELYRRLNWFINPPSPPRRLDLALLAAPWIVARYGMRRLAQALAEGQYEFPSGLFYGGAGAAPQHEVLAGLLNNYLHQSDTVLHMDLHTGLGTPGQCMLICDHDLRPDQRDQMQDWFPGHTIRLVAQQQSAYAARGSLGRWIHAQQFCPDFRYVCLEVGTQSAARVLLAMREENRAHHWSAPHTPAYRRAKLRMWEAFYPRRPEWAERAASSATELILHALSRLGGT
ncbi:MAG: DUF2817 domain-containing protein [Planctomycetota bacterium]|nr:MAG: DUF2817 domain-containing protein [Planctomycetota bacterium]